MKYESLEEVKHRLAGTVVLYNKEPVYLRDVCSENEDGKYGEFVVLFKLPGMKEHFFVDKDDARLEYKRIRLGYVNGRYTALYIVRTPARRFKQGLTKDNIFIFTPKDSLKNGDEDLGALDYSDISHLTITPPQSSVSWDKLYRTKAFYNMIMGEYPSVAECLEKLKENKKVLSQAFTKCFAISKNSLELTTLLYKGDVVGYSEYKDRFKIPKDKFWLREVLEENHVKLV